MSKDALAFPIALLVAFGLGCTESSGGSAATQAASTDSTTASVEPDAALERGGAAAVDFESGELTEDAPQVLVSGTRLEDLPLAFASAGVPFELPQLPERQGMLAMYLSGTQLANAEALSSSLRLAMLGGGAGSLRWQTAGKPKSQIFRQFATNSYERTCPTRDIGEYTLLKALINVTSIAVQAESGEWLTVADYGAGRVMDLMSLRNGTVEDFGVFSLDPGRYTQIRVRVGSDNQVQIDQNGSTSMWPLFVPAGDSTGIVLSHEMIVGTLGITSLTLTFDPNASIAFDKDEQRFGLDPVIAVAADQTHTAVSLMVQAATGATLRILGDFELTIPPGALARDTTISVLPVYRLGAHDSANLALIGHEFRLEPEGLELLMPATISATYRGVYQSAMGLGEDGYGFYTRSGGFDVWSGMSSAVDASADVVTGSVSTLGSVVLAGTPAGYAFAGGGCHAMADGVQNEAARDGLDASWFHAACDHRAKCYAHGFRTYKKSATTCNDDFLVEALARCEALCEGAGAFGKRCGELSAEEVKAAQLLGHARLYDQCRLYAASIHAKAVADQASAYPGDAASSCSDYDGRGVSCEAPTCTVTATPASLWTNVVTDVDVAVRVSGSIFSAALDGTTMLTAELPATQKEASFDVQLIGLKPTASRTFVVTLDSPSGAPAGCSVVVPVTPLVGCSMRVAPSPWTLGTLPRPVVTMMMAPNIVAAQIDLVTEGVYGSAGMRTNADGLKFFTAPIHTSTTSTRTYHGRVTDSSGTVHLCEDRLVVNP
jgi:hypothetical protein